MSRVVRILIGALCAALAAGAPAGAAGSVAAADPFAAIWPLEAPFEVGIGSGPDGTRDAERMRDLGLPVTRVEFDIETPVEEMRATIDAYADTGTRVILLAGFHGALPTRDDARNLGAWAAEFGPGGDFWGGMETPLAVREIEFGNETSYGSQYGDTFADASYVARARTYALRARDAHRAVMDANPGVGLLVQADDAGTASSRWVDAMFAAVPRLGDIAAGWTVHPYGPRRKWSPRLRRLVAQTARHGAPRDLPIYITEVGISSDDGTCLDDNYGWNPCLTYAAAGAELTSAITGMKRQLGDRLRVVLLYRSRDLRDGRASRNREHYFGVLRRNASSKGAYTDAVVRLIGSARLHSPQFVLDD